MPLLLELYSNFTGITSRDSSENAIAQNTLNRDTECTVCEWGNSILFPQLPPHFKKLAVLELLAEGYLYARAGQCVESLLGDIFGKHLRHAAVDHHGGGRPPDGFHRNLGVVEQFGLVVHDVV